MWPFNRRTEKRDTAPFQGYVAYMEALAAGAIEGSVETTAALEAAAGTLQRCLMAARVEGPDAVTPRVLGQMGRDLIRYGESLHVIRMAAGLELVPAASWRWQGGASRRSWTCSATCYGPSTSETVQTGQGGVAFVEWSAGAGAPYRGVSASRSAAASARTLAGAEKSAGDEFSGPVAHLLPIPKSLGENETGDGTGPLSGLRRDIGQARGRPLMVEDMAQAWDGTGSRSSSSQWEAKRLGPRVPQETLAARREAFEDMLAAHGIPPSLFRANADGTAQREALRRFHLTVVLPVARLIEHELTEKLGQPIVLNFDTYALDMQARSTTVKKLVDSGMDLEAALNAVGIA